ncbi:unnamed protein product [Prorocentrum cordatum]|uniref:Phosphoglycerate kinase n=1 Tax=Prorocentrum cordatum TaxID=2364126 RepID=A0ABN9Y5S8_9DINO|nr:unnamed protein product [Polarella glacialis]
MSIADPTCRFDSGLSCPPPKRRSLGPDSWGARASTVARCSVARRALPEVPAEALPGAESLKMTVDRVLPFLNDTILPCVMAGKSVLVAAHGTEFPAGHLQVPGGHVRGGGAGAQHPDRSAPGVRAGLPAEGRQQVLPHGPGGGGGEGGRRRQPGQGEVIAGRACIGLEHGAVCGARPPASLASRPWETLAAPGPSRCLRGGRPFSGPRVEDGRRFALPPGEGRRVRPPSHTFPARRAARGRARTGGWKSEACEGPGWPLRHRAPRFPPVVVFAPSPANRTRRAPSQGRCRRRRERSLVPACAVGVAQDCCPVFARPGRTLFLDQNLDFLCDRPRWRGFCRSPPIVAPHSL